MASRLPGPDVLDKLINLALKKNHRDLAKTFAVAYAHQMKGRTGPTTALEATWVRVILAVVRNHELIPDWVRIANKLKGAINTVLRAARNGAAVRSDPDERSNILIDTMRIRAGDELRQMAQARSKISARRSTKHI